MKKLFTIFTLLFFIVLLSTANAQYTKKGVVELGGTAGFSSETPVYDGETGDATTTISFEPNAGYFITNNIELILALIYQSTTYPNDDSHSMLGVVAGPGYVFDLQSKIFPYIYGMIGYNSSTFSPDEGDEVTSSGLLYGAQGGIKILMGENGLLNFGVQYLQITSEPEDWDGDRVGSNNLQIMAGFTIFLGK